MTSRDQEKQEARRFAKHHCTLSSECEFCGSTESLEYHHFAGYRLWWVYLTCCKQCHEQAEQNQRQIGWVNPNQTKPQYDFEETQIQDPFAEIECEIAEFAKRGTLNDSTD